MNSPDLSIVSPVYLGEPCVDELVEGIRSTIETFTPNFEIILVEDGSPDGSWGKIREQCEKDPRIKGIRLSRNFGQHQAITAGLSAARGKRVALLDCDLQDDPKYLKDLYQKSLEGFDVVLTKKSARAHPPLKNFFAFLFSLIFNQLIDDRNYKMNTDVGVYSMITRKVVDAFLRVNDYQRHYLTILRWLGFSSVTIPVEHRQRPYGKSSYTLRKILNHGLDGIVSQSDKLLYLSVQIGFLFFILSTFSILYLVTRYFFLSRPLEGWTSLMVLVLFSTGLILMSLGILGIYLGKTFDQVKARPLFLIDERLNA